MKDVLNYLFERLRQPRDVTHKVGEQVYAVKADGTLGDAVRELKPQFEAPMFSVSTLQGLAGLVASKLDDFDEAKVALHIDNYRQVRLVSVKADDFGRRHVYALASHTQDTPFKFDVYYDSPEKFLFAFRASFYFNEEAVKVQQLCSAVGAGDAVAVTDDGLSQEVVIKTGTVTKAGVKLPPDGVPLIPWRTFRDVSPVQSRFLLRMRGVKDGLKDGLPQIALFEIDQRWQLDTVNAIASWLSANIAGVPVIS